MTTRRRLGARRLQILAGILALGAVVAINGPPLVRFVQHVQHQRLINSASYKRQFGHWSIHAVPASMRVNAIHAALLYTGKVLITAGSGNSVGNFDAGKFESLLWDPKTDEFKKIATPTDMFCAGHAFLPDGKLLIAGGTSRYEVLPDQVHYAAGVMTVTNTSVARGTTLPKGTTFIAADGRLYRSTAAAVLPRAREQNVPADGVLQGRVVPSVTRTWVSSVTRGAAGVTSRPGRYRIAGLQGPQARAITARAANLTLGQQDFGGTRASYIFDPATERYSKVSPMAMARWYPTLVGLADGKVLSVSGLDEFGQIDPGNNELFNSRTHRWSTPPRLFRPFPTYPALFLMPYRKLFFSGSNAGYGPATAAWRTPGIWNLKTGGFKPVLGMRDPKQTETSASVLLPPAQDQRYAIIGGGGVGYSDSSTGRIDVVNLKRKHPRWRPVTNLPSGTRYPEAVITPDDKVVIAGGSRGYRGEHASDLFECHLYDPRSNKLSKLAIPTVGRDYHSEALLLPDGRIITLGGNPLFSDKADTAPAKFEQRIEIYSPPYLYHGSRPRIAHGPRQVAHGQTALYATSDADAIASARLLRPSAVTHVTDVQQRSIALKIVKRAAGIEVTIPASRGLVPPGWYMLFVADPRGTPSEAYWVRVR
jgi:galactose oxidase-like protein/radical copper oxidase GlxA-like protein